MSNEKFMNYYMDIMVETLKGQVIQNVSMQAREKINGEVFDELKNEYELLLKQNEDLKNNNSAENTAKIDELKRQVDQVSSIKNNEIEILRAKISELQGKVTSNLDEINKLNLFRSEYENLKHQLAHMDTFKSQLTEARKEVLEKDIVIQNLKEQIEYLQLTPAKRKKIDELKATKNAVSEDKENLKITIEDGGSF